MEAGAGMGRDAAVSKSEANGKSSSSSANGSANGEAVGGENIEEMPSSSPSAAQAVAGRQQVAMATLPRPAPAFRMVSAVIEKKEDGPGPRCGHTLTAVAAVGEEGTPGYVGPRLILFGGATALEGNSSAAGGPQTAAAGAGIRLAGATADVHCYDVTSRKWSRLIPVGDPPSPRAAHAATAVGTMVVIQGGIGPAGLSTDDLHVLDLTQAKPRWHRVVVQGAGPGPRYGHVMSLVGQRFLLSISGNDGKRPLADVWALDTAAKPYEWRKLDPEGEGPPPCMYATACARSDGLLLLCGGRDANSVPLDTAYGLAKHRDGRWEWAVAPGIAPSARYQHAAIFGDLHGLFGDLMRLGDEYGSPSTAGDITYIDYLFLGDYVDRGQHSLETITLLLALKIEYPNNVHLIRGNHEAADINALFGFRIECIERMGERDGIWAWQRINQLFNWLPLAALIEKKIICMHGGIGRSINHLHQIESLQRPITMEAGSVVLMDLLWSDPTENDSVEGLRPNARGPGLVTFGPDRVMEFCKNNDLQLIVRAHECVMDGFERFAQGHLITLFSATNYCGTANNAGAILVLGRDLVVVPKLIHPIPPAITSPESSPERHLEDTWMQELNVQRPPTPTRGRPQAGNDRGSLAWI
uniref:Serine/threonine-protein phosphatase n=2 Tax=Physcomitrium patens TaxID=3218 RepID=A0A2K1L8L9_PHYPA|nr:hypothetical protein PHYPA_000810 [Physcomitrium patens]